MDKWSKSLKSFERRVRLLRAWKGMAAGACIGAFAGVVWAGLDWMGWAYAEWLYLGLLVATGALLGALIGALLKVPTAALSDSIDRRGGLQDRLKTALERAGSERGGVFDEALIADAGASVQNLRPKELFPLRVGRWHGGAVALSVIAASIFLLGNTPLLLSDQAKKDKEELKTAGKAIERITKPLDQAKNQELADAEAKRLAEEMKRFARELQKARMEKPEALQKANELAKKAQDLTREKMAKVEKNLLSAESAFEKLQKDELKGTGMEDVDPELLKMSPQEHASAMKQAQQKLDDLKKQLEAAEKSGDTELGAELKNQIKQAEQEILKLKLSEEARKMLERMFNHPVMKEIQEMARKLRQEAEQAQKSGQNKMTKEQVEEMKKRLAEMEKQLDELAKQLKDEKAMQEYLEALKEAMQNACGS